MYEVSINSMSEMYGLNGKDRMQNSRNDRKQKTPDRNVVRGGHGFSGYNNYKDLHIEHYCRMLESFVAYPYIAV